MPIAYNDPRNDKPSSVGPQAKTAYFERRAVKSVEEEMYFSQMGTPVRLPKNTGNTLQCYVEVPILDDRNINDQGIDASGKKIKDGNLYGSSRDIGIVTAKMPVIGEHAARQNRVGITRLMIEATLQNFGFFIEFTESARDFDSEPAFKDWAYKKMIEAANKLHEDQIQIDLIHAAAIRKFCGTAVKDADMDETSRVQYGDLSTLSVDLDNTHTPKNTKILSGSNKIDTRTINASRIMFVGTEIQQDLKRLKDYHGERAFTSVEKYADQTNIVRGEIGSIDNFRIVSINSMLVWTDKGAKVAADKLIHTGPEGRANIYPMLVVGDDSFEIITFKSDGKNTRFRTIVREPSDANADRTDPFAKMGFMSCQWWYGMLIKRPERIALLKTTVGL